MTKKTIWGNTIVKNEDKYVYFAMMSAINYLDKLLVYDSGSTDNTVAIIKIIQNKFPKKIIFQEIGDIDSKKLTMARQKMLEQTKSDWFLILDGDEVWWSSSLEKIVSVINQKGDSAYALVTTVYNLVGDVYHYQPQNAGKYKILNKTGHLNIRAVNRKIPGLHLENDYPLEGYFDSSGSLIQKLQEKLLFVDVPMLHFSHLSRSSKSNTEFNTLHRNKIKYELGKKFSNEFKFPEALYFEKPGIVPSPWIKRDAVYISRSLIETPLKMVKRKILKK